MRTVSIENIGPIERAVIPLPEQGGVVVLRGRNGSGKSWALNAVDALVSGRGQLPCRDGAPRGIVSGFGAKLTVARSTRRIGEAEVITLEGRLDVSQLVSPPVKDEEAADRVRIKALIQLSGQPADPRAFRSIIPDWTQLEDLVPASDQASDPVSLAGQIKRALQAEARRYEKELEQARAELNVLTAQLPDGVSPEVLSEVDQYAARVALQNALLHLQELETRREMATRQAEQQARARSRLTDLEQAGVGDPALYDGQLAELDRQIAKLEQALAVARERREQIRRRRDEALRLQKELNDLRAIVEQPVPVVSDEDLAAARAQVEAAQRQYDNVMRAIEHREICERIEQLRNKMERAERRASLLRSAAEATDEVLSHLVTTVTKKLWVQNGRLVCETDRGTELFSDLSLGERWRLALEIAVEQVGKGGLVVVPQEAWEGLDPVNRLEVAQIARQVGVVILTAEADSSDVIQATVLE